MLGPVNEIYSKEKSAPSPMHDMRETVQFWSPEWPHPDAPATHEPGDNACIASAEEVRVSRQSHKHISKAVHL